LVNKLLAIFGLGLVLAGPVFGQGNLNFQFNQWALFCFKINFNPYPPKFIPMLDTFGFEPKVVVMHNCEDIGNSWVIGDSAGRALGFYGDGDLMIQSYDIDTETVVPNFRQLEHFLLKGVDGGRLYFMGYDDTNAASLFIYRYRQTTDRILHSLELDTTLVYPRFFPQSRYSNGRDFKYHLFYGPDTITALMADDSTTAVVPSPKLRARLYRFSEKGLWEPPLWIDLPLPPTPKPYADWAAHVVSLGPIDSRRYLVRLLYYPTDPIRRQKEHKGYLLLVRLMPRGHSVKSIRVIDSTATDRFGLGTTSGLPHDLMSHHYDFSQFAPSPSGRYVYLLHHLRRGIMGHTDFGRPIYRQHTELYQIDTRNGHRVELTTYPGDSFLFGNPSLGLAPNGQVYLSALQRTTGGDKREYFGAVGYPDKGPDSCRLTLMFRYLYMEHQSPDHWQPYTPPFPIRTNSAHMRFGLSWACGAGGITVRALDTATGPFTAWRWYLVPSGDSTVIDSANGPTATFLPPRSGEYVVRALATTPTGYRNWRLDYISYFKPPSARIIPPPGNGCQWVPAQFDLEWHSDTVLNGSAWWHWEFYLDDSLALTASGQKPRVVFDSPGAYRIRLVHSNGYCTDTAVLDRPFVVLPARQAGFTISDTFTCTPAQVRVRASIAFPVDSLSYLWSDGAYYPGPNLERTFQNPGHYWIAQRLYFSNGCVVTDTAQLHLAPGAPSVGPTLSYATHLGADSLLVPLPPNTWAASRELKWRNPLGDTGTAGPLPGQSRVSLPAPPVAGPFAFRLRGRDSCGTYSPWGARVSTMWLESQNIDNESILLRWTPPTVGKGCTPGPYQVATATPLGPWTPTGTHTDTTAKIPLSLAEGAYGRWAISVPLTCTGPEVALWSNQTWAQALTTIFIPNAFTPNADGHNDHFFVQGFGIDSLTLDIYSRWGQVLWSGRDQNAHWDGTDFQGLPAPMGEYFFVMRYTTHTGIANTLTGTLTLIR
jgi:gliding motility-associated-like protein